MNALRFLDRRVATAFFGAFRELRPVQEQVLPPVTEGRNVVVSAGTGSGKTEAATAPLVSRFWLSARENDSAVALYVSPTKALANDLCRRLGPPLTQLGLRVGVRHGDRDDVRTGRPPHLLVTTPESLDVLLVRGDQALSGVEGVVLDEVHLLYNTQRGLQLAILLRRLRERLSHDFQWAALSATLGNLAHVRDFLFGPAEDAVFIESPAPRPIDAHIRQIADLAELTRIIAVLVGGRNTKLLMFAQSRRECEQLAEALGADERLRGRVYAHYSSLSTELRLATERSFAEAAAGVCVATSTLELGIDIGDINAVVLWGAPNSVESFLQRIGRGNRRGGKSNVACFIPPDNPGTVLEALRFLSLLDAARKGDLPERAPYELYGAVAQQCLSEIAARDGSWTKVGELCKLAAFAPHINRQVVDSVLDELAANEFLQRHGFKNQYGSDVGLHRLIDYRLIYANFSAASQTVEVRHGRQVLGDVPAENLLRIRVGDCVRFAGRPWRVRAANRDAVSVEPCPRSSGALDFTYRSQAAPLDGSMVDRMWRLIHRDSSAFGELDPQLRRVVVPLVEALRAVCGWETIPVSHCGTRLCYLTFAGRLVNTAIAQITRQPNWEACETALFVAAPIVWGELPTEPTSYGDVFHLFPDQSPEPSLYQTLLPASLQFKEALQRWLCDESVAAVLRRLAVSSPIEVDDGLAQCFVM